MARTRSVFRNVMEWVVGFEGNRQRWLASLPGTRGGIRTPDARLRTAALYPLSYSPEQRE